MGMSFCLFETRYKEGVFFSIALSSRFRFAKREVCELLILLRLTLETFSWWQSLSPIFQPIYWGIPPTLHSHTQRVFSSPTFQKKLSNFAQTELTYSLNKDFELPRHRPQEYNLYIYSHSNCTEIHVFDMISSTSDVDECGDSDFNLGAVRIKNQRIVLSRLHQS